MLSILLTSNRLIYSILFKHTLPINTKFRIVPINSPFIVRSIIIINQILKNSIIL